MLVFGEVSCATFVVVVRGGSIVIVVRKRVLDLVIVKLDVFVVIDRCGRFHSVTFPETSACEKTPQEVEHQQQIDQKADGECAEQQTASGAATFLCLLQKSLNTEAPEYNMTILVRVYACC